MPDEKTISLLERILEKLTDIDNVMPGGVPLYSLEIAGIEHVLNAIRDMLESHERRLEEHAEILREIRDAILDAASQAGGPLQSN
ncbi:MAG: hypothetical protein AB7H90_08650 [Alphaproteobacteria bacterium]